MIFRAPTSHLQPRHQGYLYLASPPPAGYRQAPLWTKNHRPTASPPPSGFGWVPPESLGMGPGSDWGEGVRERRRVPAETPGRAFLSHALRPRPCRLRPWVGREQHCYHDNARGAWGRVAEGPRAGRGREPAERARAGSGRPEARYFLGIFRHFSINESPTTAVPEPRSRPPILLTIL